MSQWLRAATASQEILLGPFVDYIDGSTAETGLTISNTDIKLRKHGGTTLGNKNSGGATHISNGWYYAVLDATDTDTVGLLDIVVNESGALPVMARFLVLPAVVFDALLLGTDNLDVNVAQWLGTAVATPTVAGVPEVDVTHWRGTAVPAEHTAGYPIVTVKDGTGTGEIDTASGRVAITEAQIDQIVDEVWDEVLTAATHNVAGSSGRRLRTASGGQIDSGTAQAGSSDTITLATSADTTVGLYVGCAIVIDGGTGAGQSRYIIGYTAGRVATVARPWTVAPDVTSTYVLYADNQIAFLQIGLAAGGGASSITLDANASSTNEIYAGQSVPILGGTGKFQTRTITAYDGGTKVATVTPAWVTQPDATSYYAVQAGNPSEVELSAAALAAINAEADAAIETYHLDHLLAVTYDPASKPGAADALLNELVENDGGIARFTANALEQAPSGSLTVQDIVDGVWDEDLSLHAGVGSTGEALAAAAAGSSLTVQDIVDGVWDETLAGHVAAGNAAEYLTNSGNLAGALSSDTYGEPISPPSWPMTIVEMLSWLALLSRNKLVQDSTSQWVRNAADDTTIGVALTTDSGGEFTRNAWA